MNKHYPVAIGDLTMDSDKDFEKQEVKEKLLNTEDKEFIFDLHMDSDDNIEMYEKKKKRIKSDLFSITKRKIKYLRSRRTKF